MSMASRIPRRFTVILRWLGFISSMDVVDIFNASKEKAIKHVHGMHSV